MPAEARRTLPYEPKRPRPKPTPQAVLICLVGVAIVLFGAAVMWISGNLDIGQHEQQSILAWGICIALLGAVIVGWSGRWILRQMRSSDHRA